MMWQWIHKEERCHRNIKVLNLCKSATAQMDSYEVAAMGLSLHALRIFHTMHKTTAVFDEKEIKKHIKIENIKEKKQ